MKRLFIIAGILLAGLMPLACQKTYTVPPLATSPAIPVYPTATPTCSYYGGNSVTCAAGIIWGEGSVANYDFNSVYQYAATLALAVNCMPETTDGVTLTGPGVTLPLTYSNTTTLSSFSSGVTYALYESNVVTGGLTTGSLYTLTSVTSIGTASASIALPSTDSMAFSSAGTTLTWSGNEFGCNLNLFLYQGGTIFEDYTGPGFEAVSPLPLPYGCVSPCSEGADFIYTTTNITGGSGNYSISNGVIQTFP